MNAASQDAIVARALAQFAESDSVVRVAPVTESRGFSGASLWRVDGRAGSFCLRRWPAEHPDRRRLTFIHHVLSHVADRGLAAKVAVPLPDRTGRTIVEDQGTLWELTHWIPGQADFHQCPSAAKLADALRVLAEFHRATDTFESPVVAAPPGIVSRISQLRRLMRGGYSTLLGATKSGGWPRLACHAEELLACFPQLAPPVLASLERAAQLSVRVQPCIRDIWHDHVFFEGDRVSGFIDFGAMRPDHVAGDIARLLGSLVGDQREDWMNGLAAYEAARQLSSADRELITAYDRSGVLLSGMNWLSWIYLENRHFDDHSRISERLDGILARVRTLRATIR